MAFSSSAPSAITVISSPAGKPKVIIPIMLLALIFSLTGIVLGVLSKLEKDMFYFFSYLGIILNLLAVCAVSFILYAGAYGL